jgi:uncharacterized protein (DUF305 family)
MMAAQDYNDADSCGVCAMLAENTEAITILTDMHNNGANVEMRNLARAMIETRLKEADTMQAWMAKRGIQPTPADDEGMGDMGGMS